LDVNLDQFFAAHSTLDQIIPANNFFASYEPLGHLEPRLELKEQMINTIKLIASGSTYVDLSTVFSEAYKLVADNRMKIAHLGVFLALVTGRHEYTTQLDIFNSLLAVCSKYKAMELSNRTTTEIMQFDLPLNSSTSFALVSWTILVSNNECIQMILTLILDLFPSSTEECAIISTT
jgi:hypothetical protein